MSEGMALDPVRAGVPACGRDTGTATRAAAAGRDLPLFEAAPCIDRPPLSLPAPSPLMPSQAARRW